MGLTYVVPLLVWPSWSKEKPLPNGFQLVLICFRHLFWAMLANDEVPFYLQLVRITPHADLYSAVLASAKWPEVHRLEAALDLRGK